MTGNSAADSVLVGPAGTSLRPGGARSVGSLWRPPDGARVAAGAAGGVAVRAGWRAARDCDVNVRAPSSAKPTVRRTVTATVPLRPDGSSRAVQDTRVAALAAAIRDAAAHGWPPRPICCAADSAARSAARSSRCLASTADPRSTVSKAVPRTSAPKPSTQIVAEPRSERQLTRSRPARWRPRQSRRPPPTAASSPDAASAWQ